jgi:2-polyprenyl-3-methyl-5-hydroxy-6-metoxy-1,4-benzoquinol methylase
MTAQRPSRIGCEHQCPACGSFAEPKHVYEKWGYAIRRCADCGLGSASAGDFDPATIYSTDYFTGGQKDGYADYVGSEMILRRESRKVLRGLAKAGRKSGSLLEIGSAYGFFLAEASDTFEVEGIEPCEEAAAFCRSRGFTVTAGLANSETMGSAHPVDVVVLLDVIEHLPNPLSVLELANARLKPGGHLVITTGDWDSLLSRSMKSSWRLMTPPQHLFFFSRKSLAAILGRAGFRVLEFARPSKLVPLSLICFQLARILGMKPARYPRLSRIALPVNLFDAFRVISVKERSI